MSSDSAGFGGERGAGDGVDVCVSVGGCCERTCQEHEKLRECEPTPLRIQARLGRCECSASIRAVFDLHTDRDTSRALALDALCKLLAGGTNEAVGKQALDQNQGSRKQVDADTGQAALLAATPRRAGAHRKSPTVIAIVSSVCVQRRIAIENCSGPSVAPLHRCTVGRMSVESSSWHNSRIDVAERFSILHLNS